MTVSVFDLFKIGIGPSSSHTVGPMRAALKFATSLADDGLLDQVSAVRAELFGSLGATGHGHGSVPAVVLGLSGELPETVDPAAAGPVLAAARTSGTLTLLGRRTISFDVDQDVILHRPSRYGIGFQLTHKERPLGTNPNSFGHFGAGGTLGFCDPDAGVAFGYVIGSMGPRWQNPRYHALIDALYACLG